MNTLGIDIRQVRMDALSGRLSVEQLLDIMDKQQHTVQHLHREMQRLTERLAQYEPEVRREAAGCQSSPQGPSPSYSLDAEEKTAATQALAQEEISGASAHRVEICRRPTHR